MRLPWLLDLLKTADVPDDDLSPDCGGEIPSVRTEGHAKNVVGVSDEGADLSSGSAIPELYLSVTISGGQILPRRVERHAKNARLMPLEGGDHVAVRVPDLRGPPVANGSEVLPVAAEGHAVGMVRVSRTSKKLPASLRVPERERLVGRRGKGLAVGAEGHAAHHHLEAGEVEEFLARLSVPELHG